MTSNNNSNPLTTENALVDENTHNEQKISDPLKVSIWSLYKYAEKTEKILLIFGLIGGVAAGTCLPVMCVIVGFAIDSFSLTYSSDEVLRNVSEKCLWIVYNSLIMFFFTAIAEGCWIAIGERLGIRVRILCLESILKKGVPWFDVNRPQELPSKIGSLIMRYQSGIGEKVGKMLMSGSMFLAGVIVAFMYGWRFALALLGIYPLTVLAAQRMGVARHSKAANLRKAYSKCAGYAEEALCAIRTVYAFCAEQFEQNKYVKELINAKNSTIATARATGAAIGLLTLTVVLTEGLGFYIGSYFIEYDIYNSESGKNYNCASIITVFFAGMFAMISLGLIAPALQGVEDAKVAAYEIYDLISDSQNSNENIEVMPTRKLDPQTFKGRIEFKNVTFSYPAKPDVLVLKNFNMVFEAGHMTGICGETGSGKSTIIQLIERFYKPNSGVIEVDGVDINTLDLKWWREMLGFVGQEPVLFNTTIKENIGYGKNEATEEEIIQAATNANAIDFINRLEKKLETETGAGGGQLSGGQKQRVAIARALVRKPKIVLLDEATSALDSTSERKVQDAFNEIQKSGTMSAIVVAHRLSTIKNAPKIIVLNQGVIVEQGNDCELRARKGIYSNLCKLQDVAGSKENQQGVIEDNSVKIDLVEDFENGNDLHNANSASNSASNSDEELNLNKPKSNQNDLQVAINSSAENSKTEEQKKKFKSQIWSENWKYKWNLIFAILLSVMAGYNQPMQGTLLGMVTFDMLQIDKATMRKKMNEDFIGYIVCGVGIFFIQFGMHSLFGLVSAKVACNLRKKLFEHVLKMDIGWFDMPENQPFAINHILGDETEKINGVVEKVACTIIQAISALCIAFGIAFYFSYKMAAIILGSMPVLIFAEILNTKFHVGYSKQNEALYQKPMGILSEAVRNFRTVTSFSNEHRIVDMYKNALDGPLNRLQNKAIISGFLYGICQMIPFLIYAEIFYLAAWFLVRFHEYPRDTFISAYALCFTALEVGTLLEYGPDIGKAWQALSTVYGLLEHEPAIKKDNENSKKEVLVSNWKIQFQNVSFKYPTREEMVLQGLNMTIEPGQKVTIVGPSGSGKSTIIQLLERFYDPLEGKILIDGIDIKELPLQKYREMLGYVPQEPYLFDATIEENVKYGNQTATSDQVRQACEIADAIDFIERRQKSKIHDIPQNETESKNQPPESRRSNSLGNIEGESLTPVKIEQLSVQLEQIKIDSPKSFRPVPQNVTEDGFKRMVGAKGSLLSGGQKQRLAIARAILKNPMVMLFDEATSALDSETESEVQEALRKANKGRTSVTVAHRLSAVGEEDVIFVLENGKITESGSKRELMSRKGAFYKLYGNSVSV